MTLFCKNIFLFQYFNWSFDWIIRCHLAVKVFGMYKIYCTILCYNLFANSWILHPSLKLLILFSDDLVEKNQKEITIHDLDALALTLLVDFAYTGEIVISEDNVQVWIINWTFVVFLWRIKAILYHCKEAIFRKETNDEVNFHLGIVASILNSSNGNG